MKNSRWPVNEDGTGVELVTLLLVSLCTVCFLFLSFFFPFALRIREAPAEGCVLWMMIGEQWNSRWICFAQKYAIASLLKSIFQKHAQTITISKQTQIPCH